jgi:single-strand DNA-binding protein
VQRNRLEVAGYLAARPSLRYLPSGTPVANARLGQTFRQQVGRETNEQTNWFSLAFYGELAHVAVTFDKGDNIDVIGSIQQRQFTPRDGSVRVISEVVVHGCHLVAGGREISRPDEDVEECRDAWALL